jgi:hypothetical protein
LEWELEGGTMTRIKRIGILVYGLAALFTLLLTVLTIKFVILALD